MDSYKNFTGHRYECILSKYRVIFPRWVELKHISMDFKFCLLAGGHPSPCSDCLTRTCPKVIISRLIPVTTGVDAIANDAKMPVTRSSKNSNFLT